MLSRCRDGICVRKMCYGNNEKCKTTLDRKNRTTKSRKNQNAQRKGNVKILGNTESGHHQTSGDERKIKKRKPLKNKKTT